MQKIQKHIGRALTITCAIGLASLQVSTVRADVMPMTEQAAGRVVQGFCQAEFDGDSESRFAFLKFTQGGKAAERHTAGHGMVPGVRIFPEYMPLVVVTSYVVEKVEVRKDRGRATVLYRTVVRRGEGGVLAKLIPFSMESERVDLQVVHAEGRWRILDPPLPRVSLETMIQVYRTTLAEYEARFQKYPEHRERDKKHYGIAQENLKLLESLPAKVQ
jgi:hypothetical protein